LRGLLGWADRLLAVAAGAVVAVLLGTVTAGIVSRALNRPLAWTDELSGYLMAWLACMGWMLATRHGAHIRISVFQDKLPRAAWRATEVAMLCAAALVGGVVAWYAVHLVRSNADIEALALPISAAWLYVPLIPAGIVTALQALADLRAVWRRQALHTEDVSV
jgi:TRAP-type C4-dicarboxylate transport system permease small subunit